MDNMAFLKTVLLDEIWSTVSTLLELVLAEFGRDPCCSDSLRGSRIFFGEAVKTLRKEF